MTDAQIDDRDKRIIEYQVQVKRNAVQYYQVTESLRQQLIDAQSELQKLKHKYDRDVMQLKSEVNRLKTAFPQINDAKVVVKR